MKSRKFTIHTPTEGTIDITAEVRQTVKDSGVQNGIVVVFCPHTTGGIMINENADPDVQHDLVLGWDRAYPEQSAFRHFEGNSTAHLKSSVVGPSQTIIVEDGEMILGIWQDIYFCEFDGPRVRSFYVKVMEG